MACSPVMSLDYVLYPRHDVRPFDFGDPPHADLPGLSFGGGSVDPSLIIKTESEGSVSRSLLPPFVQDQDALLPHQTALYSLSYHSPASSPAPSQTHFTQRENSFTFHQGQGRGQCQGCGNTFKDLKAHLLTHQTERPEKCPIMRCEYQQKGFARKYDASRHTLTHYKGTMVCGFCPGSGTPAEKRFYRSDVFKRHLTSVHGVEQTPPGSRKAPRANISKKLSSYCADATGMCSICLSVFSNAQAFYAHLDPCVLNAVLQQNVLAVNSESGQGEQQDANSPVSFSEQKGKKRKAVVYVCDGVKGFEESDIAIRGGLQASSGESTPKYFQPQRSPSDKDLAACDEMDLGIRLRRMSPMTIKSENRGCGHRQASLESILNDADSYLERHGTSLEESQVVHRAGHFAMAAPEGNRDTSRQLRFDDERGLESEGEISFMASPPQSETQSDYEKLSDSQRRHTQRIVADRIVVTYTAALVRARAGRSETNESSSSSTIEGSSASGSRSSQVMPESPYSARKRGFPDEEKDRDENEEQPRKRSTPKREYGTVDDGKLLACPYSKFDPARYSELNTIEMQYRGCSSCFLTTIPRLKQHLYRVHSRPLHYCSCCFQSFQTAVILDTHARSRSCTVSPSPFEEKMTTDQMTEIKRRTPREERSKSWFTIFRILFPRAELPQTPFVGQYSEECIDHFLQYFEREAPRFLTETIESELQNSALLLQSEQRRMLDEILEASLSRLVVAMTQAARSIQSSYQQPAHPVTRESSSPVTSRSVLEDSVILNGHSGFVAPHRHLDTHFDSGQAITSQPFDNTHSWVMVDRNAEPNNVFSAHYLQETTLSGNLPRPVGFRPYNDLGFVDHRLASEEWQRLVYDASQTEIWQDGALRPGNSDMVSEEFGRSWFH